ncbi:hypothetical protein A3Q56_01905 [Intoshia linei]|uniref:DH domain-containing protein n=1 Tax=Intoshia linei TaxID=1819745 RepID=A0A177B7R8_9BILA|nr:hypothetical protein A3Q56_01905 [Intoshia linei]
MQNLPKFDADLYRDHIMSFSGYLDVLSRFIVVIYPNCMNLKSFKIDVNRVLTGLEYIHESLAPVRKSLGFTVIVDLSIFIDFTLIQILLEKIILKYQPVYIIINKNNHKQMHNFLNNLYDFNSDLQKVNVIENVEKLSKFINQENLSKIIGNRRDDNLELWIKFRIECDNILIQCLRSMDTTYRGIGLLNKKLKNCTNLVKTIRDDSIKGCKHEKLNKKSFKNLKLIVKSMLTHWNKDIKNDTQYESNVENVDEKLFNIISNKVSSVQFIYESSLDCIHDLKCSLSHLESTDLTQYHDTLAYLETMASTAILKWSEFVKMYEKICHFSENIDYENADMEVIKRIQAISDFYNWMKKLDDKNYEEFNVFFKNSNVMTMRDAVINYIFQKLQIVRCIDSKKLQVQLLSKNKVSNLSFYRNGQIDIISLIFNSIHIFSKNFDCFINKIEKLVDESSFNNINHFIGEIKCMLTDIVKNCFDKNIENCNFSSIKFDNTKKCEDVYSSSGYDSTEAIHDAKLKKNAPKNMTQRLNSIMNQSTPIAKIVCELIETEHVYLARLQKIVDHYIPVLERSQYWSCREYEIFSNVEALYKFHNVYFLPQILNCQKNTSENLKVSEICNIFLNHIESFMLYSIYNANKPCSEKALQNGGYLLFQEKQRKLNDALGINSLLLEPVQRLSRYLLILTSFTKIVTGSTLEIVESAINCMNKCLGHGNDLLEAYSVIECPINLKKQGKLICKGKASILRKHTKSCNSKNELLHVEAKSGFVYVPICSNVLDMYLFDRVLIFTKNKNNVNKFKFAFSLLEISSIRILSKNPDNIQFCIDVTYSSNKPVYPLYKSKMIDSKNCLNSSVHFQCENQENVSIQKFNLVYHENINLKRKICKDKRPHDTFLIQMQDQSVRDEWIRNISKLMWVNTNGFQKNSNCFTKYRYSSRNTLNRIKNLSRNVFILISNLFVEKKWANESFN